MTFLDLRFAKTVQRAPTRMEVMLAYASMAGPVMTAVRILTTVSMQLASTELLALMVLGALVAAVHLGRLDYCAIWKMLVHQIPVMPMPYARQVQSMDHSRAHALKVIKDPTAPKTLTNASKVKFSRNLSKDFSDVLCLYQDHLASTMEFV